MVFLAPTRPVCWVGVSLLFLFCLSETGVRFHSPRVGAVETHSSAQDLDTKVNLTFGLDIL
jgi:hypothetical protein